MTKRSRKDNLARKAPHLRAVLAAITAASGVVTDTYEREEVETWLESMIRADLKTARGGYVGNLLRKIHDKLDAPEVRNDPKVKHAIYAIRSALHHDGWRIWEEAYLSEN
jgi:hypothetical protein